MDRDTVWEIQDFFWVDAFYFLNIPPYLSNSPENMLVPNEVVTAISATDEIYICGRHVFHDTLPYNLIAIQGKIGIKSGQDSLHHLVIRGDYPGDSEIGTLY